MIARALFVLLATLEVVLADPQDSVPLYRYEDGAAEPYQLHEKTSHIAYYFSASWCPPCRKSTPPLVEEYERMRQVDGMPVEIVLVGSDRSEAKMFSYMKKYEMSWPAVVYAQRGLVEKYAAAGIPHLVLVERESGKVVAHGTGPDGVERVVARMRDFSKVANDEPFKVGDFIDQYGVLVAIGICFVVIMMFQKWREKREVKNL